MCSCRGPSTCKQGRRLYKRCSCKQWPCTYTAPCVARTCWEESQTHIAAPLWQRRSTHPARALMYAANAPRRGRSCTDQQHHTPPQHRQQNAQHHPHTYDQTARRHPGHMQHTPTQPRSDTQPPTLEAVQHPQPHTIRPPDSTKARPTTTPDRLFVFLCPRSGAPTTRPRREELYRILARLHNAQQERTQTAHSTPRNARKHRHTVRAGSCAHARRQIRQGSTGRRRSAAHRKPMPQQTGTPCTRFCAGTPPADTIRRARHSHPDPPQQFRRAVLSGHAAGHPAQGTL